MKILHETIGTCSTLIEVAVDDGVIKKVKFAGGCPGNLKAMAELVKGMEVKTAIEKLEGIKCGNKSTSCADQLAQALKSTLE